MTADPSGLRGPATLRLPRVLPWVAAAAGVQALRDIDPQWAAGVLRPGGGAVVTGLLGVCVGGLLVTSWRGAGVFARVALVTLALGAAANLLATALNGGMPFDVVAARTAGIGEAAIAAPPAGHVAAGEATRLAVLGDVFSVHGRGVVLSAGDVLLVVGAVGLALAVVVPHPGRHRAPSRDLDARRGVT